MPLTLEQAEQVALAAHDSASRLDFAAEAGKLYAALVESVSARRESLTATLSEVLKASDAQGMGSGPGPAACGPGSARDAALAEAWFRSDADEGGEASKQRRLARAARWLSAELESLRQVRADSPPPSFTRSLAFL